MKNSNLKKTLIISASILVLTIVAYLAYEKHMSYDIEPHESFMMSSVLLNPQLMI
ncbi:MAG: hypothetical protein IJS86_01490 [Lachnospiraceae bacterium]|nr:hypothetical protein [Lachnospiraceae bacterium]